MTATDEVALFAALRRMWRDRDPVPEGLADDVLVALSTRDLADEYALLTLVEESSVLAGTRASGDLRLLDFREGELGVTVRVSELGEGRVRIDGWLTPPRAGTAHLEQERADAEVPIGAEGRFAFPSVRRGASALRVVIEGGGSLATEPFEL